MAVVALLRGLGVAFLLLSFLRGQAGFQIRHAARARRLTRLGVRLAANAERVCVCRRQRPVGGKRKTVLRLPPAAPVSRQTQNGFAFAGGGARLAAPADRGSRSAFAFAAAGARLAANADICLRLFAFVTFVCVCLRLVAFVCRHKVLRALHWACGNIFSIHQR